MKRILIIMCLFLVGCKPEYGHKRISYSVEIPPKDVDKAAKYIIDLCRASNPMSDEEPEDMIRQARYSAIELYGVRVKVEQTHNEYRYETTKILWEAKK